jgi:hypothetical protein
MALQIQEAEFVWSQLVDLDYLPYPILLLEAGRWYFPVVRCPIFDPAPGADLEYVQPEHILGPVEFMSPVLVHGRSLHTLPESVACAGCTS